MKYSINRAVTKVGSNYVTGPVVGSTAWGLGRFLVFSNEIADLIKNGSVHYAAITYEEMGAGGGQVLWLCSDCEDTLTEIFPSIGDTVRMSVNTTSEGAAKALCMHCKAEKQGLPELMMNSPDSAHLSPEEREYIRVARAAADDRVDGWPVSNDGYW